MAAITLAEAKAYLRIDNTVEDDLITKLIGSATTTVENVLRQPLSAFDPLPDDIHTANPGTLSKGGILIAETK